MQENQISKEQMKKQLKGHLNKKSKEEVIKEVKNELSLVFIKQGEYPGLDEMGVFDEKERVLREKLKQLDVELDQEVKDEK